MKRLINTALFAVLTCFCMNANAAPVQWAVGDGGNGHYYEAISVPGGISWTDAKAAAELQGGYLATIGSQAENDFVYALVDNDIYWNVIGTSVSGPWLGGFHGAIGIPNEWEWVTSEPFSFTNWYPGRPDYLVNFGQTQNALHYYGAGTALGDRTAMWDDDWTWNPNTNSFVVERVPEPSSIALFGIACAGFAVQALRRGKRRLTQDA